MKRRGAFLERVAALSLTSTGSQPKSTGARNEEVPMEIEATPNAVEQSKLSELPQEILLQIASKLCGNKAMVTFATASKQFHSITQEAMARDLKIGTNGIKKAVEMLLRNPRLIPKVNRIDLGAYQAKHTETCLCISDTSFDRKERKILRTLISNNSDGATSWSLLQQVKGTRSQTQLSSPKHQFFMDILMSLCPNIRDVNLELRDCPRRGRRAQQISFLATSWVLPTANPDCHPVSVFDGASLALMQRRLRSLTIVLSDKFPGPTQREMLTEWTDRQWRFWGRKLITLPAFHSLKQLDIPMDLLGLPQNIVFQTESSRGPTHVRVKIKTDTSSDAAPAVVSLPAKYIPMSLTTLRLRFCTGHTFELLEHINTIPTDQLQLRKIECHFPTCARTSILRCKLTDLGLLDYVTLLNELEMKDVKIDFYTSNNNMLTDMRNEISVLKQLPPIATSIVALTGKQFSDFGIEAASRLSASIINRRLFFKHGINHFNLFSSPIFNGRSWCGVPFFQDSKNTRYDPHIRPQDIMPQLTVKREGLGFPVMKLNRRKVMDINDFKFIFTASRSMVWSSEISSGAVAFCGKTFVVKSGELIHTAKKNSCAEDYQAGQQRGGIREGKFK
ncbi:hypothetical protein BKA63DRAFT_561751 [Paraphoma chrysanthemicola]|nr:hypothetical protein BKA63DRAFT_561751 [Paraphoma chrysanthemicola]